MKKYFTITTITIILSSLINSSYAIDTLKISSKITDVTVFFSGAQITRQNDLKLNKGKHYLLINNLPQELNPQSIQVNQILNSKILSVKHQVGTENDSKKSVEEISLETKIEGIQLKMKSINNQLSVYTIEERLLSDNSQITKKSNGSSLNELKETADYYHFKLNEIKQAKLNLLTEFDNHQKSIQDINIKINELLSQRKKNYSEILIAIECLSSTSTKLNLSYFIPSAGWEPLYDFRVDEINKPLTIVYNANVFHSSGEDWKNVNITLSNNNPTLDGNKPELIPWYLDRQNPYTQTKIREQGQGSIKGSVTDRETGEALPFANVVLFKGNEQISGTMTDFDGRFSINPISSGTYSINISYVGYSPQKLTNIHVNEGKITFANIIMGQQIDLQAFEVVDYEVPLISKDQTSSGGTITMESIQKMPGRSSSDIAATVGGVHSNRDGSYNIRGSRSSSSDTYIDGIRVRKNTETTDLISNTLKETATNIEYKIDIPYSIPSNGENYNLKIKEVNLPVDYIYHAIPKLEKDVFLSAIISDWSSLNLLSGKSSIYYQGTFTSESYIDVNSVEDSLYISLGRDNNITVNREGNKLLNDKKTIGNYIKQTVAWDITVKNNKQTDIHIVIEDQHPLSERKSIEVELLDAPNAKVEQKTGILTWDLTIPSNNKETVNFKYDVKFPKTSSLKFD